MMEVFFIVFAIFLLVCVLMSLGMIYRNKPLKGSCGGLSNITGEPCSICGATNEEDCEDKPRHTKAKRGKLKT